MSVTTPVSAGTNTYSVSIKALKPSVSDIPVVAASTHPKTVKIFAMDSFGAESLVTEFDVVVNRPPVVGLDLTNVVLYRDGNSPGEARAWTPSVDWPGVTYTLTNYFDDLDLSGNGSDDALTTDDYIGDTTCTFSTSPKQPTGQGAIATPLPAIEADPATATTLATVNNGAETDDRDWTTLVDTATTPTETTPDAAVVVSAVAPAGALGPLTLTITCEDPDATVSSEARITVRSS